MLKQLQMGLRAFMLIASKVWSCFCYMFRKQYRAVNIKLFTVFTWYLSVFTIDASHVVFAFQLAQYQSVKYEIYPLSPVSRHRLSKYELILSIMLLIIARSASANSYRGSTGVLSVTSSSIFSSIGVVPLHQ